jgi:S-adenosyl-L-methionine hydrolase (adenosine-forming)
MVQAPGRESLLRITIVKGIMSFITLTTDFGLKDGFVGTLKGVIWNIYPQAQIADISHNITSQNVLEGAFALWRAYSFFPDGTVHVAVVDPGVGTQRRPIAARLGKYYFVGPDNGLFTPIIDEVGRNAGPVEFVHLDNPKYWLPNVSHTFHGRDIFAPVAAYLAKGIPLAELGSAITAPVRLKLPKPEKTATGWRAHVTIIDTFGNCTTDLPASFVLDRENIRFRLRGRETHGLVESYGHRNPGDLVALVDSENYIEIAIVNDSATKVLGAQVGDVVDVITS